MASWFDDMSDSELLDLIPFFEKLSKMDNVYTVLCNSNHPYSSNSVQQLTNGPSGVGGGGGGSGGSNNSSTSTPTPSTNT